MLTKCLQCDTEFNIKPSEVSPKGNCCSKACSYQRKTVTGSRVVRCGFCGKEFTASSSRLKRGSAKHCSKACAARNRARSTATLTGESVSCLVCGSAFYVSPSRLSKTNVKFCSKRCRGIHQTLQQSIMRLCLGCQNPFRIKNSELLKGYGKFCSVICRRIKHAKRVSPICKKCGGKCSKPKQKYCSRNCYHVDKIRQLLKACANCGKEFCVKRSKATGQRKLFCSVSCKCEGMRSGQYKECPHCGSTFYANNAKVARNTHCFCSQACAHKWSRGPRCAAWRGGVTPLYKRIRDSKVYKRWRDCVFERDGYTCQLCASKSGKGAAVKLEAHHIQSFVERPDLILSISNGQTLCRQCHQTTESWGRKPADKLATIDALQKILDQIDSDHKDRADLLAI